MTSGESTDDNVVQRLYDAFEKGDALTMEACYAPDAIFRDEVFDLHGRKEIGGMWHMLLTRGKDLEVTASGVEINGDHGRAHWEATYTFSKSGAKVHNVIDAEFVLKDGLIVQHIDKFDFWKWSRQALGPIGTVFGWTPIVRGKVQSQARRDLDTWLLRGV